MSKKRIENFDTPQQKAQKSSQKILKFGCLACFAIACVFTAQNLMPLDFYVNPGIDENTKFVVAHAGGGMTIDGKTRKYLNVVEGVEHHYAHGTRMFEIDFAFSKENELVGTHRYEYLKGFSNKNRIGIEEYKNKLILDKFHGLTSERLFELMQKYPDAKFIIDTKENEPFLVYEKLIEDANAYGINLKESVIPFASSKKMLEKIEAAYDFDEIMFTNYKAKLNTDQLLEIVKGNKKINYLHIFPTDLSRIEVNEFNKLGIRVFAHMDNSPVFHLALDYGCTGIFSDDITEDSFNLKYRYILEQKLIDPKIAEASANVKLDELLGLSFPAQTFF